MPRRNLTPAPADLPAAVLLSRLLISFLSVALLSACSTVHFPARQGPMPGTLPVAGAANETIGTGSVTVALLLPRSGGNGAATALAFRNAAELALRDFPNAGIKIAVHDTRGTPDGAKEAVRAALGEGAEMVLGPVFSAEVSAVAPEARRAGVPVVAFSSDASVAGPGVHLLSFLPSDDVNHIVAYSASQGRRSFAALIPANAYGAVVEASFRQAVAAAGGRIVSMQAYTPDEADIGAKAAMVAAIAGQVDALFLPGAGDIVPPVAAALAAAGVGRERVKLLGSGQWDDARILNDRSLVGSWFPAPSKQGFAGFARKYQAAYGSEPPRNATLAYDATVLAAGLVRQYGADGLRATALASPNGFTGADGLFRFVASGLVERRYAIFEVTGSGARQVAPAARSFSAGG